MKTKKIRLTRKQINSIAAPFLLVFLALLIAAFLILAVGKNPILAYKALFQGAFGSMAGVINTLNKAIPICLCAFAVSMSQKGGTFNIGVEGQLLMGASACALVGIYAAGLPAWLHIALSLLAGMAAGMVWCLVPTFLYIKKGVSLLVIFLLMNSIADFLLQYIVLDKFASSNSLVPATEEIAKTAWLPNLITRPNKLSAAILVVLICAAVLYWFYRRTVAGYEMKATGLNARAALISGIRIKNYMFYSLMGGALMAGLGGALEIMGNHHRLYTDFSPGYGYDGIPIALLSRGNPVAAVIGSLLFGALRAGSINMRAMSGVSNDIVSVIQGLLIMLVACQYIVSYGLNRIGRKKETYE